ncbi:hypothetical protein QVD17_26950 [Tagetes erecta]|uniref:BZIP domain-containing protein n=1 Tax=Tagetes erecta TaxID=13708 RepID=A0AAD8KAB9_TARER|nr:hypothetical protein QVD17_26950 [Tagetes erecta]
MMDQFNHSKKEDQPFISRTFSEFDFEEIFKQSIVIDNNINNNNDYHHLTHPAAAGPIFSAADAAVTNLDSLNRFSSSGGMTGNPHNLTPSVTMTMDSQSSICAASPTSDTKPKRRDNNVIGATSDDEQLDYDPEIETGQCEQSNDNMDIKKIKRMFSNRESARRSRKRKQAHLTDLEQQVEQLRAEYSALFKQLTTASHQYKDASTNNRVLKSEVEALRAKVKLAEDTLARGSLTSSLSHLLQNHLATPQLFNFQNISRMGNVSPTITVRGDDHGPHPGLHVPGQHMMVGLGTDPDIFNGNVNSGISGDGGSCVTEIWSQDAHSAI